jgi:retinol dehydrogenase 12
MREKLKGNMNGKICLVTGATNGIGKAAAQALAQMGATVVIVGRDAQKAARVTADIKEVSGNQNVDYLIADLSSQQEILRLAGEFKNKYQHLHVLLNNAGGTFTTRLLSADGIEMTFALNHLAYFLLTNLLLDTLMASSPARIINVSSDAHSGGKIEFGNLQSEQNYSSFGPYGNSKLANILFTTELAHRLEGTGVTVNALHPGLTSTGFGSNNTGFFMKIMKVIIPLIGRTPERGAETSIYLASSPEVQSITGKYFVDCKVTKPALQAEDRAVARKLWDVSTGMVHLTETAIPELVVR